MGILLYVYTQWAKASGQYELAIPAALSTVNILTFSVPITRSTFPLKNWSPGEEYSMSVSFCSQNLQNACDLKILSASVRSLSGIFFRSQYSCNAPDRNCRDSCSPRQPISSSFGLHSAFASAMIFLKADSVSDLVSMALNHT